MTPFLEFIMNARVLEEPDQDLRIKRHYFRFVVLNGSLYWRSYQDLMIKIVADREAKYIFKEIHEGCFGEHASSLILAWKTLLAAF